MGKEGRFIEWEGRKHKLPEWVKDVNIYLEYLKVLKDSQEDPDKYVTFSSGKVVAVDYPHFKRTAIEDGYTEEQIQQEFGYKIQKMRASASLLASLKMKAGAMPDVKARQFQRQKQEEEKYAMLMLELFGRWFTPAQVHKKLVGMDSKIRIELVRSFYEKNKEKIRELRNKLQEDYSELSIGVKRSRLEYLNFLLEDLYNEYDGKSNQGITTKLNISKEIRGILEQARKEVEGDELKLTINGRIDVEATINVVMKNSVIMQDLTISQIVASRVCQRVGVSYNKIVHRLANSFYSKYNGFRKSENVFKKIDYPSSINYDIVDMRPKYEEWLKRQGEEQIEDAVLVEEQVNVTRGIRDQLLERLNIKKEKNEQVKKRIE